MIKKILLNLDEMYEKLFSWNRTIIFSYLENLKPVLFTLFQYQRAVRIPYLTFFII